VLHATRVVLHATRVVLHATRVVLHATRVALHVTRVALRATRVMLLATRVMLHATRVALHATRVSGCVAGMAEPVAGVAEPVPKHFPPSATRPARSAGTAGRFLLRIIFLLHLCFFSRRLMWVGGVGLGDVCVCVCVYNHAGFRRSQHLCHQAVAAVVLAHRTGQGIRGKQKTAI
jgi:hypothetical protein